MIDLAKKYCPEEHAPIEIDSYKRGKTPEHISMLLREERWSESPVEVTFEESFMCFYKLFYSEDRNCSIVSVRRRPQLAVHETGTINWLDTKKCSFIVYQNMRMQKYVDMYIGDTIANVIVYDLVDPLAYNAEIYTQEHLAKIQNESVKAITKRWFQPEDKIDVLVKYTYTFPIEPIKHPLNKWNRKFIVTSKKRGSQQQPLYCEGLRDAINVLFFEKALLFPTSNWQQDIRKDPKSYIDRMLKNIPKHPDYDLYYLEKGEIKQVTSKEWKELKPFFFRRMLGLDCKLQRRLLSTFLDEGVFQYATILYYKNNKK